MCLSIMYFKQYSMVNAFERLMINMSKNQAQDLAPMRQ